MSKPMMMPDVKIDESYDWKFDDYNISSILLPLFVATETLDNTGDNHNGLAHILNMSNVNHRLCSAESIQNIQNRIRQQWHDRSKQDVGSKFTVVPYKLMEKTDDLEESIKKANHCKLCLSHEFFNEDDDVLNKCTFKGYNTSVKSYIAVPFANDDFKKLKLDDLQLLKFDNTEPTSILQEFATKMLPREKTKEWSDQKHSTFSDAYLHLQELFQENVTYRFGICDGAHCINAIYNIIAGITINNNNLAETEVGLMNDGGNNIAYSTTWQIGMYRNLSK